MSTVIICDRCQANDPDEVEDKTSLIYVMICANCADELRCAGDPRFTSPQVDPI